MNDRSDRGPAVATNVARLLDGLVTAGTLPGASVLVLRDGREEAFHAAGFADMASQAPLRRDTLFRIYSMTKPITAAAVMMLVDDGALGLDDPLSRLVPELDALRTHDGGVAAPVTIRHLLTHTAGFSYHFQQASPVAALYAGTAGLGAQERWRFDPAFGGLDGLAATLAALPLAAEPGRRWHYGMSLDVAGLVVERAAGERFGVFLQRRLFDPLGMRDTGFAVAPDARARLATLYTLRDGALVPLETGATSRLAGPVPGEAGGGGLVSTIDDYARFAQMLLDGGEREGVRLLSADAVRAITSNQLRPDQLAELPHLAAFGLGGAGDGLGFGLGGAVVLAPPANGVPAAPGEYGWGGAASTTFWIDPANALAVVLMTQLFPPSRTMLRDRLHAAVYAPDEAD